MIVGKCFFCTISFYLCIDSFLLRSVWSYPICSFKFSSHCICCCSVWTGTQFKLVMQFGWHRLCLNGKWEVYDVFCIFLCYIVHLRSVLMRCNLFRYAALGKIRTRYLLYKDVNRNPLWSDLMKIMLMDNNYLILDQEILQNVPSWCVN